MEKQSFNQLFEGSSEGIIVTDINYNVIYFNDEVLHVIPNLPKKPQTKDLEIVINFNCDLNLEISYDLFELDYYILITKKDFSFGEKEFYIYRIKAREKDSIEQRFSFFLGNIDEIVYTEKIFDDQIKRVSYISKGIKLITGVDDEEMIESNKLPHHFAYDSDRKRVDEIINRVNTGHKPGKCQFRVKNKKTDFNTWVELSVYPQISEDGFHFANFGVIRDISKDIEADQLLRQSELKHRLLFSEANDAIMIFKGIEMVDCNEKTLSMFDSPGFVEIAGKKLYELMPEKQPNGEDSILNYHYYMQKAIEGHSQFFDWRHAKLSGAQFDSEVSINSFTVETDTFVQVIVRDITQRKIAEEQKNQSIKSYFEIFNYSSDLIFIVNNQGKVIDVNQSVLDTYDSPKSTIVETSFEKLGELKIMNDDDFMKIGKAWAGEPQKFEWHCKTSSGNNVPLEMILHPGTYFGKEVIIASGRDIRERLDYENIMKESEARFRTLASHAPIGIFLTDRIGNAIYVNDKLKELAYFPSVDGFMDNWLSKVHPDDQERIKRHIDITEKENHQQYEYRVITKNGDERWVKAQVNLLKSPTGEVIGRVGTIEDITKEIQSAKLLKESEQNYRQLVEILPDSIILHGSKHIKYLNPKAKAFLNLDESKQNSLINFANKQQEKKIQTAISNAVNGEQSPFFETKIKINKTLIDIELCAIPFIYNNEPVAKLVIHDITSRKRAEKEKLRAEFAEETTRRLKKEIDERIAAELELKSAKEYNQYIINSSIDMIIATDTDGKITEFNQAAANGFGYFSTSVIGGPVDPLFGENQNKEKILKLIFQEGNWSGELQCKRADDSTFIGYLSASLIEGPNKEIIGTMGVLRDITELKQAEEDLKNNVHQKEILLKEVHHRVKNNLQVISSILNLQTGYIEDEGTLAIVRECQDRIKSMAFIHESLYQKEDFAEVNFAEYLQNLCNNLKYSYMRPDRNILLDFDIDDISLSLDSAIPCGLIVNELVSNCFKYAFKDQVRGNIKVSLAKENNNKVLVVHDSGQGLPQDLNIETNDSLGLQLVWTLVDQIDGEIKYEYASGSKFIINFKRD